MSAESLSEGTVSFDVPGAGKPCYTWYKIVGHLSPVQTPLITLHGGPGACHELLLPLIDLNEKFGIPIIFYDQLGNGRSTHLRERNGDEKFWTVDLFIDELENLIDRLGLREHGFDILGQSWGGQLGSTFAARRPRGLRKLVIANAPASVALVIAGMTPLKDAFPENIREIFDRAEKEGRFDSKEYKEACLVFHKRHICRLEPWPRELKIAMEHIKEDSTVPDTMWGQSEMSCIGSLKDWTVVEDAHKIQAETFLINGRYDQVQDMAIMPFFERIPRVRWVTLENSSHLTHLEERERYMELLGTFLRSSSKS